MKHSQVDLAGLILNIRIFIARHGMYLLYLSCQNNARKCVCDVISLFESWHYIISSYKIYFFEWSNKITSTVIDKIRLWFRMVQPIKIDLYQL